MRLLSRRLFSSAPPIAAWEVYGPSRWVNEKLIAALTPAELSAVRLLSVGAGTGATDAHLAGQLRKMGGTVAAYDLLEQVEVPSTERLDENFISACGVPATRHVASLSDFARDAPARGEGRDAWTALLMAGSVEREFSEGADLGELTSILTTCFDLAPRVFLSGPLDNPLYAALFTDKDSGDADGGLFLRTGMLEQLENELGVEAEFACVPQLMDVTEIKDEEQLLTSLHFDGEVTEDHTRAFLGTLVTKWRNVKPHPEDGRLYLDIVWSAMAMLTKGKNGAKVAVE